MLTLDVFNLSEQDRAIAEKLLVSVQGRPTLADIWRWLDEAWDELGCDARRSDSPEVHAFYRHPVWVLSGLFGETDPDSIRCHAALRDWLWERRKSIGRILDFGAGIGTLPLMLAERDSSWAIDLYEPLGQASWSDRMAAFPDVKLTSKLENDYDAILCKDVMEHVTDPICLLADLARRVRQNGVVIFGNTFRPFVKCHLPQHFHLFYTFDFFARQGGLKREAVIAGTHLVVYRRGAVPTFRCPVGLGLRASSALYPLFRLLHRIWNPAFFRGHA